MLEDDPSEPPTDKSRRAFLLLWPTAAIASMFASVAAAAYRFLRPVTTASGKNWIDVAALGEIIGDKPIVKKVVAEHAAGWAKSLEAHSIFILPAKNNQVLSAVCPHEGCEVSWLDDMRVFACPCHESNFAPDGSRIHGPAQRGLDPLPSRVEGGKLQIQYQFFINNIGERIPRT